MFDLIPINPADSGLKFISILSVVITRYFAISLLEETILDYKAINPNITLNPQISNIALGLTPRSIKI